MQVLFTNELGHKRADEIVDYLMGPRLWIPQADYPDFDAWAIKVHAQLKSESKRAMVAWSRRRVMGAIVYQRHHARASVEIKNLTVRPDAQGRYVAAFLLRNTEIEGCGEYGVREVVVDAKARNVAVCAFFYRAGYRPLATADLYGLGAGEDVVFRKAIRRA